MSKSKRSGPDALEMSRNRKKVDQYGFTMHAKEESEEDLKKADSNNGNTEDDMEGGGRRHDNDGRIMQTMSVTVAYDQVGEGGAGTTAATRWAAV